jgi:hypothetical protein
MKFFKIKIRHGITVGVLLSIVLLFGACAQKAKMIQAGALQFEEESIAAIEKIDELRRKETEAAPLPPDKTSAFFVNSVKKSTQPITLKTLEILIAPLKTNAPKSEAEWQAFLQKMRRQYTTFAVTFANLDKGSLFAAPHVKEAIPILDKLIAQMAAFAASIRKNPAEFIRERAAIAAELEQVRDTTPHNETTDLKLLELERRLREVVANEEQITRDTIAQALKAVTLGVQLRALLEEYDKLSLNDIADGISTVFKVAGSVTGLNLSELKAELDDVITMIKKDGSLSELFETALSEISKARIRIS